MVCGAIEVALRGGDESIRSNLPNLEATDANPCPAPPVRCGADQRPVILNTVVLEAIRVPPPPVMGRNWNTSTFKIAVIH
jgi:hypothetical protein